jgi:lysozyme family protein
MTDDQSIDSSEKENTIQPIDAYDPMMEALLMSRADKIRATALVMAIKYTCDTIIKDAEMLREVKSSSNTPTRTVSHSHVIEAALDFEKFLNGETQEAKDVMDSFEKTATN